MSEELLWAYGVVATGSTPPGDLVGVAGGVVAPVAHGDLVALTGRVPRADFAAEPLREHLNDLAWLQRVAFEHEAVLEHVIDATTVVPLRLCTIFEDDEGVQRMLEREHGALLGALRRLDGREEWGVKLLLDRRSLVPGAGEPQAEGGLAYLARRRQEQTAREEARSLAAQIVDDVDGALRALSVDAVRLPAQNRELSRHEGDMVLNGAYLVEDAAALREAVAELQERHSAHGARLELTGPWPPYNFVVGATEAQPA